MVFWTFSRVSGLLMTSAAERELRVWRTLLASTAKSLWLRNVIRQTAISR